MGMSRQDPSAQIPTRAGIGCNHYGWDVPAPSEGMSVVDGERPDGCEGHGVVPVTPRSRRGVRAVGTMLPPPVVRLGSRRSRRAILATLALVGATFGGSAVAHRSAAGDRCATPVTGAPTAPAVVSAATTPFGRVLVVGAGPNAGCSLYLLTSDQTGGPSPSYGCTGTCATTIWPALLTDGAPVAGPGVDPHLLGTVTRTDIVANTAVQQVTYDGHPLYQFFLDTNPGETHGADLFDGRATPPGVWYLVDAGRGVPAPGAATLAPELVTVGSGSGATHEVVLAALLNTGAGDALYPVYTFSADRPPHIACTGTCAVFWPPLLTARPGAQAAVGVDEADLGTVVRPDGTVQVTYDGQPLYLFVHDAASPGSALGNGVTRFGGTFQLVPLS
jgi:predicted lipoprotein with Yx(FWY)xxD motif